MNARIAQSAISRRHFMAGSLAGGVALAAGGAAFAESAPAAPVVRRPAKHVIFVLMSGAASQFETFDPKPGQPTGGAFGTIATGIPGMRFCEYLPKLAGMTDHFATIRSITGATAAGDHVADLRRTLTGHAGQSRLGVERPAFGSIVAQQFGREGKLPGYINLSPSWHDAAFQGSGCLGAKFDMLKFPGYGQMAGITTPPVGHNPAGYAARNLLRDQLSRDFLQGRQSRQAQRYEESFERARGLMDSTDVFDLSREPEKIREAYGPSRYGADCLTARRLIEHGVPFVLIQCFGTRCDWDWHYEAFSHLSKYMLGVFDDVTTTLVNDLRQRGLWDETLLICVSEFGRTPDIGSNEANGYGGRAHWGKTYSLITGGGPIKGGQVIGSTNADGTDIADRPITIPDVYRSAWYPALGINPDGEFTVDEQPIKIQEEGELKVTDLLA
jgi:hypothetical protein